MAKWFKEFPINFRNGSDKIRSALESDSQNREKPGGTVGMGTKETAPRGSPRKGFGGGVSCLLSGRNRKNSANDSCHSVSKDEKVWDSLMRRNSKSVAGCEEHRSLKNCISASTYITRLMKVEKQDRIQNPSRACSPLTEEPDKGSTVGKTDTVIIRDDYADPFDAQSEQSVAPRGGENDGYMEPYDAQQLITEIRRRGSKDLLEVGDGPREDLKSSSPLLIYDDPYEGAIETPVSRPEPDPRSPVEYEQPREWGREQILKALSVPFDDADRPEHPASAREEASHLSWPLMQHLQRCSWTQKTPRPPPSPALGGAEGDGGRVDPSMPLEKQSWYHGSVTRQEVDSQLQSCKEGSFLVRDSESGTSKYSIALKTNQGCVHIILAQTKENGYTLDQSRCTFPSIPQVVHYYCSQPLPFPGANHMTLMHPVPRSL